MKAFFILIFLFAASPVIKSQCPVPKNYVYLHTNQIRAAIPSAIELFTVNEDGAQFLVGKTPSLQRSSVYNSGIWISGIAPDGEIRTSLQTNTFAPFTHYTPGPISPSPISPDYCTSWDKVWSVTKQEIDAHIRDYIEDGVIDQPISSIFSWPGNKNPGFLKWNGFELPDGLTAPFWDEDNNGIYNPETGDFPFMPHLSTQPDQFTWSVFNDKYSSSRASKDALNIQIERSTWAYHCQDNEILDHTIFVRYKVTNKGTEKIDSCFMGLYTDFDLGCPMEDMVGTSQKHNAVYVYNSINNDQACFNIKGFEINPPVQALTYLNKPLFASFIPGGGRIDAVQSPKDAFLFLNGLYNDGVPQTAAGQGYKTNGPVTKYSYSGDPNTPGSWSMFQEKLPGKDVNTISSTYLGTLTPGTSSEVDLAYVYVREDGKNHLQNITTMYAHLDSIQKWYQSGIRNICTQDLDYCTSDCVWPGDANNDGIANHLDVLAMGLNFRISGPSRPGILNWAPKHSLEWSKKGQKHSDANGNGSVERSDVEVTAMHYNQTRSGYKAPPDTYPVGPELKVINSLPDDFRNIQPGKGIFARVGIAAVPDLKCVAFSLEYDPNFFLTIQTYNPSSSNLEISFSNRKEHQLEVAHCNTSFNGTIPASINLFTFEIIAREAFGPGLTNDSTWLRFKNVTGIKKDGSTIPIGGTDFLATFEKNIVSADPEQYLREIGILPNPASEKITILFHGTKLDRVQLFNATGSLILVQTNCTDQLEIDVTALPPGFYFLKIEKQGYSTVEKVLIE